MAINKLILNNFAIEKTDKIFPEDFNAKNAAENFIKSMTEAQIFRIKRMMNLEISFGNCVADFYGVDPDQFIFELKKII